MPRPSSNAARTAPIPELTAELRDQLRRGRELLEEQADTDDAGVQRDPRCLRFPTALTGLDRLLGGGVARGSMVEVIGHRTSGRFSLVLSTLAATTRLGEAAALVDLGDHFDPQGAADAGVALERLLWLRPEHVKPALGCVEILLDGGFPLVIFDLGLPPVPGGRGAEAAWLRLARAAQAHRGALLVTTPYRASGTAASMVLQLERRPGERPAHWAGSQGAGMGRVSRPAAGERSLLLDGLRTRVTLSKSRPSRSRESTDAELDLHLHSECVAEPLRDAASPDAAAEQRPVPLPDPTEEGAWRNVG